MIVVCHHKDDGYRKHHRHDSDNHDDIGHRKKRVLLVLYHNLYLSLLSFNAKVVVKILKEVLHSYGCCCIPTKKGVAFVGMQHLFKHLLTIKAISSVRAIDLATALSFA